MFDVDLSPGSPNGAASNKRVALLVAAALVAAVLGFSGAGSGVAQTNTDMVTFSGTVTAESDTSTANVMVSLAVSCWDDSCESEALPDDQVQRPLPLDLLDPVVFLAESEVDSSGSWSVTVSRDLSLSFRSVLLVVWDANGQLASQIIYHPSDADIDIVLDAGGRVSGSFTDSAGGALPPGDYALLQLDRYGAVAFYALDVDPQTGAFTSPVVAPGYYNVAYGNLGGDYLNHNAAALLEVAAGQTTDAGTIELQRSGQITGKVTDSSGQGLGDITISGRVNSQNHYWSMPGSPFNRNGSRDFWYTTADDGTYTAKDLVPGEDWELEIEAPSSRKFTAIASGEFRSCAITTDSTIACWGRGADPPEGQYTAIALDRDSLCAIRADNRAIDCQRSGPQVDRIDGQYTSVAAGSSPTCAIRIDQAIDCWNNYLQTDPPDGQYIAVSAGGSHSCAIKTDNTIACWGLDQERLLVLGINREVQTDAPDGQYTAIAVGGDREYHSCAIRAENQAIVCWGNNAFGQTDAPDGQYTAVTAGWYHSCAIKTDNTIACWGSNQEGQTDAPDGQYTAVAAGGHHSCAIKTDNTIACWGSNRTGQATGPTERIALQTDVLSGGETALVCAIGWNAVESRAVVDCSDTQTVATPEDDGDDETTPEDSGDADAAIAAQCFEHHKFGAQPVDVAKTADRETVLAQLRWGFHESIGCFLTLDEAALQTLRAAPAPLGFPSGDPDAAQQCSAVHKFGAQPVDVAKSADRQTVLAQVSWGFHESIGCYLTLDIAATAALRAAHT